MLVDKKAYGISRGVNLSQNSELSASLETCLSPGGPLEMYSVAFLYLPICPLTFLSENGIFLLDFISPCALSSGHDNPHKYSDFELVVFVHSNQHGTAFLVLRF